MISGNSFNQVSFPESSNAFALSPTPIGSASFTRSSFPLSDLFWQGENITGNLYGSDEYYGEDPYGGFEHFKGRVPYTVR